MSGTISPGATYLPTHVTCTQGTSYAGDNKASMANFIGSAVIGSLPKGLTDEARRKVQGSVPMSPASAAMQKLNMVRVALMQAQSMHARDRQPCQRMHADSEEGSRRCMHQNMRSH